MSIDGYFAYFFCNDTATTEIYTLSLHDALPISWSFGHPGWANERASGFITSPVKDSLVFEVLAWTPGTNGTVVAQRSEEHTSELQSRQYLVCRLLLEKKKSSFQPVRDSPSTCRT